MNKNTAFLLFFLALSGLFLWKSTLQRKSSPLEDPRLLIVGTNTDFRPFSFIENNEIVGFDIDVIKEVAHRIDKQIMIKDMPFDSLMIECIKGYIQVIAAGVTATPERAKKVLFTTPYINNDALYIVTLANNAPINSEKGLIGKRVIVNDGFTADSYMAKKEGVELLRIPTVLDAMSSLRLGRADAYVTAMNPVKRYFDTAQNEYRFVKIEGSEENCSLAVCPQSKELFEKIEQAIQTMIKDGTIDTFKKKWDIV